MARRTRHPTVFGKDLDNLLEQAGKFTLREYADECGVSYKYISQLRTIPERRPGRIYVDLLKPFVRLQIVGLQESHRLSLRHRAKPLTFNECRELFPTLAEQEIVESVKRANTLSQPDVVQHVVVASRSPKDPSDPSNNVNHQPPYRRVFVGREAELRELRLAFDNAIAGHGTLLMVAGDRGLAKRRCANSWRPM